MTKIAIIGTQFGDEGKGKIIDLVSPSFDVVARYQGGHNAEHTIMTPRGKEIILHLLPSSIIKPGIYNILLAGVLVDPLELTNEIKELRGLGYRVDPSNFGISNRTHMNLDFHKEYERMMEDKKGKDAVGTTMKGIGPTAITKYAREGLRFREFLNPDSFERYLESLPRSYRNWVQKIFKSSKPSGNIVAKGVDTCKYLDMYQEAQEFLRPFIVDEAGFLKKRKNDNWLYESAQGCMLDIDAGTYPYVTSSNPILPPSDTEERWGISKAYTTRVGYGNLPTQMEPDKEKFMRGRKGVTPGAEYGATTGRPRNCGWWDGVIAEYAVNVAAIDELDMTKMDRFDEFEKIKICIAYKYRDSKLTEFPVDRYVFEQVEPVYIEVPGWKKDTTNAREPGDLPQEFIDYLKRIEDIAGRKIHYASVGQKAEQTIDFSGY